MNKYESFRKEYPVFRYNSYSLTEDSENIYIFYDFQIDGLTSFKPEIRISKNGLDIVNNYNSPVGRKIVFYLGMVEVVSYLKSACCPLLSVECGYLNEEEKQWWKKLYFGGLGEFFYINGIDAGFDDFLEIKTAKKTEDTAKEKIHLSGRSLVPVGGGKDSAVTAEIVKKHHPDIKFFTVNDQKARTDTVITAGYSDNDIIKTYRKISPELLDLNKQGFLNGHTPFSAIVAFLSLYCAYLTGSENIILSNEASANETNIKGKNVNHQYSKSYEFECDFTSYVSAHILEGIRYFSILRPFNELQIAKQFCKTDDYLYKFRSCNAGSKKNIWCCSCPKCLFVYCMLSAFLSQEKLTDIFGENMLEKENMVHDFDGLVGLLPVKPFECVGTISEIKYALAMATENMGNNGLPFLLNHFREEFNVSEILKGNLIKDFNSVHNVPEEFINDVKEMYDFVSGKSC